MTGGSEWKGPQGQSNLWLLSEEGSQRFSDHRSCPLQTPSPHGVQAGFQSIGDGTDGLAFLGEHPGGTTPPKWWSRIARQFALIPGPRWLWWTLALVAVIVWGLADIRLRGLPWPDRPLEHKTDFTVYTAAGRAFFTGQNPYEVTNPRGWKYLYPPLFALLVAPLSLLPMAEQCLVWYFISVAFCWGCYREAGRILNGLLSQLHNIRGILFPQWVGFLGTMAFLAALFPTLNCLQRGQVGILKLYLLLLGVRLVWLSAGWVGKTLGGLALAGAIALKLTPALAVGMVLWSQLAAVLAGWWRRRWGQTRTFPPVSEEPVNATTHSPHFAYIPKTRSGCPPISSEERPGHFRSAPSPPPDQPQGAMKTPPKHLAGRSPLSPGLPGSATGLRSFTATTVGVGVGLILFFFLVPAGLVGWQKTLEHLAYWAHRVFPSAGEGFPVEAPLWEGPAQDDQQRLLPANYRTVRNQSLANAMFRLAALTDRLLLGGPDDQQLDYVANAPNRIDTPMYQTVQKASRVIVLVALLLAGGLLGAKGGMLGQAAAFGLGCVGILVLSPVSWGHYFMLLAPAILLVPLWLLERGWARAAYYLAAVPTVLSILHYSLLELVGRMGLLGLGTAGWLLAACILVFRIICQSSSAGLEGHRRGDGSALGGFETAPSFMPPLAADRG